MPTSKTKHTPGPWTVDGDPEFRGLTGGSTLSCCIARSETPAEEAAENHERSLTVAGPQWPYRTVAAGWQSIAFCPASDGNGVPGQNSKAIPGNALANARLIAAAPEMLEALKRLLSIVDENVGSAFYDEVTEARAAIAKAEGR